MSDSEELLGAISLAHPPRHRRILEFLLHYSHMPLIYAYSLVIECFCLAQKQVRPRVTTVNIRKVQGQGIQNEAVSNVEWQQAQPQWCTLLRHYAPLAVITWESWVRFSVQPMDARGMHPQTQ